MFEQLPAVAVVFALVAAVIHVLFFVLESVLFRRPFAWRSSFYKLSAHIRPDDRGFPNGANFQSASLLIVRYSSGDD